MKSGTETGDHFNDTGAFGVAVIVGIGVG